MTHSLNQPAENMSITNEQLNQLKRKCAPRLTTNETSELAAELLAARKERDELRNEVTNNACGDIHIICMDAGIPPGHVVDRVRALAAKVAELEADREMIEWIEAQAPNMFCLCEFDDNEKRTGFYWEVNDNFQGKTFRSAIRAARAASAKNHQNDAEKEGK